MHDPYVSCRGCPNRHAGCHVTCDGYQSREAEKEIRYALKERAQAAVPDHAGYKKILRDRQRHEQMKGR